VAPEIAWLAARRVAAPAQQSFPTLPRKRRGWFGFAAPEVTRTAGAVRLLGMRRSQVPRRRRPLSGIGLAVAAALAAVAAVAAIALTSMASLAQTPLADRGVDLLQPSLDGNPATPPRFRRPQAAAPAAPAAPSRIGATPVYGSPSGFGAGDTGFDSTNARRRKTRAPAPAPAIAGAPQPETTFEPVPALTLPAPSKPPAPTPKQPPEIHPAKAAGRPGAALPPPPDPLPVSNPPPEVHPLTAANRPGAIVPIPPPLDFQPSASTPPPGLPPPNTLPLGTPPQRTLPIAAGDAYSPIGIRGGSFLFFPAVELSTAYDSNPQRVPGGAGSSYFVVAPELQVRSDWSRHLLTADIRGSYTEYGRNFTPSLDRPYLDAKIDGRIDVSRETQVLLENRFVVSTDNPGSPNLQAGLAKLPINTTVGGTLGVAQEFNRLQVTVKSTVDRSTYADSVLTDGEIVSNADRNFDQYAGILRVGYELDPGLKPFVEVGEDARIHDQVCTCNGQQRDSTGLSAKLGGDLDLFGSLTGEVAVGYLERTYKDPTLPDISGVLVDGSLIWQATALTTARFTAASSVSETTVPGVSGTFSHDFNLQVDHALRRWLIGTLKAGYGRDDYVGSPRQDSRYFASASLIYKMTRTLQVKSEVREDWLTSSVTGVAYDATSFLVGLRLQR
jgi:hypothetical protein